MTRQKLTDLDFAHLWHPFTQQSEWTAESPLIIAAAQGCELIDTDGRRYLDGVSSLWVGIHGHGHPRVDAALHTQIDKVAHSTFLGLTHEPGIRLAEALVRISPPGLERVFYSDSGSTAVEVALKMAYQCQQQSGETQRTRFAALSNAYHGDTIGSVSLGGIDLFHQVYRPLLFGAQRLEAPVFYEREEALAQAAVEAIRQEGDTLAALIVEPLVQGATGMHMHSPTFLDPVLTAAREVGALVILDEVATGFGRTGSLFAAEQLQTPPDFLCLGKGLTNGTLPLAATLTTTRVYEAFLGDPGHTFFHGHTYTANPLGCAAALACIEVLEEEQVIASLSPRIDFLGERLEQTATLPWVHQVRQKGLMVGIELRTPEGVRFDAGDRVGKAVCALAREKGVILRPLGDTLVLMPALVMPEEMLLRLVDTAEQALQEHLDPS